MEFVVKKINSGRAHAVLSFIFCIIAVTEKTIHVLKSLSRAVKCINNVKSMKRSIPLWIFIMLCLSSYSQTKGIKCTYVSTWNIPNGVTKLREELRNVMLERMHNDHKVYSLTIANGQSVMVKEPESVDKMPLTVDVQCLYMDLNDSISVKQSVYMNKLYVVKEQLDTIRWNIEKTQEQVLGYTCYKATCTNENGENTAWFTTDIPISHAPLGFYGLPGLVVRITTPVYTLDLKDIAEVDNVKIEAPQKGAVITKDDFQKLKKGDFQEMVKGKTVRVVE